MLEALLTLLLFQLAGEALTLAAGLALPGPVLGMALLFLAWPYLQRLQAPLDEAADALLSHFGLLFVPAGTGVMLHLPLLAQWWAPLLLAVLTSSLATQAATAAAFQTWVRRRR